MPPKNPKNPDSRDHGDLTAPVGIAMSPPSSRRPRRRPRDREQAVANLAAGFITNLGPDALHSAYERGPEAMFHLCCRWAEAVTHDLPPLAQRWIAGAEVAEVADDLDAVREHAEFVLTREAWISLLMASELPARDEVPSAPANVEARLAGQPGGLAFVELPRRLPRTAAMIVGLGFVAECDAGSEPAPPHAADEVTFWVGHVSASRDRRHWILWGGEAYSDGDYREPIALAACRRRGVTRQQAALYLMRAYWEYMRDCRGVSCPDTACWLGLVDENSLYDLFDSIWPEEWFPHRACPPVPEAAGDELSTPTGAPAG